MIETQSTNTAYSRALYSLLWGNKVATQFFDEMECKWLDGGCHTLARALHRYLEAQGHKVYYAAIVEESPDDCSIQHVVTQVYSATNRWWYLDANGVQTADELLGWWEQRLKTPLVLEKALCDPDDLAMLELEVPIYNAVVQPLADLLQEELGPCPL